MSLSMVDEMLIGERSIKIQMSEVFQELRPPESSYQVGIKVTKDNLIKDDVEVVQGASVTMKEDKRMGTSVPAPK